jgi:hypothetical protein
MANFIEANSVHIINSHQLIFVKGNTRFQCMQKKANNYFFQWEMVFLSINI